ncbi:hypothetical protein Rrhod_0054 [Rhodococcus rhodnii LMG 5362]|uniref:Uncharacterized protein n=1 Tax=Rhodococcus rhodnii LMG 5362 TaxID=1273125 RepID=R7WTB7_9NOCA|nr:hypothetical protein Rrhod_0054 [Rhodococcus rhodnii LMG 5362]
MPSLSRCCGHGELRSRGPISATVTETRPQSWHFARESDTPRVREADRTRVMTH